MTRYSAWSTADGYVEMKEDPNGAYVLFADVLQYVSSEEGVPPGLTAKLLEELGYVRRGGPTLTYQGGDNIAPTAVEHYNPKTGHAVLEYVSVQPLLLEKGKENQYVKRYLYWAALTPKPTDSRGEG